MSSAGSDDALGYGVHELRVRYSETDQMGVAHHAAYVPWIEEARTEWMRSRGRSYRELEESGLALVVTRVALRYLRPARYDDFLRIETRLIERRKASVELAYRVFRDGELLCEAETRLGLVGPDGRPMRLPEELFSL